MKNCRIILPAILFILFTLPLSGQVYVKMNGLYVLGGILNPAVELPVSRRGTFQSELVYSPWQSITYKGITGPFTFGIFMNEYRRYFKERNDGWYLGLNGGLQVFKITKPEFSFSHGLQLQRRYGKGYGMLFGIAGGYEWKFKEKWLVDVYFGWSFMSSFSNYYALQDGLVVNGHTYKKGEIIMHPQGHDDYKHPDPWNGSAEWYPNKIGVSIGYIIFDPKNRKNRR